MTLSLLQAEEMTFHPAEGAAFIFSIFFFTAWFFGRDARKETEGRPAFMSHHEIPSFMKEGDEFEVVTGGIICQELKGFALGPLGGDHYLIVRLEKGEKTTQVYFIWTPSLFSLPSRFVVKRIHGEKPHYEFGMTLP